MPLNPLASYCPEYLALSIALFPQTSGSFWMKLLDHSAYIDTLFSLLLTLGRAKRTPTMHFQPWDVAHIPK